MQLFQLKKFVIEPVLAFMGQKYASPVALQLLLDTIAIESQGKHIDQRLSAWDEELGPAISIYQIEPATHADILFWLKQAKHSVLAMRIMDLRAAWPDPDEQLATNLAYATAIARAIYYRVPYALPEPDDLDGIWDYYKVNWNSLRGATTKEAFMWHHQAHVAPILAR
tara:strand:+ start:1746 stop:2249 length:504 start_codon:yes stop_codon:yes gene_type:complete